MQVDLNGQPRTLPDACTVQQLIESLNLSSQACAVEVNKSIVPRKRHAEHQLTDGDHIELVTLVGGG